MLKKLRNHKDGIFITCLIVFGLSISYYAHAMKVDEPNDCIEEVTRLATQNAEMRLTANRMTRAKTAYRYPKFGEYDFIRIKACAKAVKWPSSMLTAIRKTENGVMFLDLGIQSIPKDIRENYPPSYWQFAAGQRIMVEEAGKMILNDPEVAGIFAHRLAKRWKAKHPERWVKNFIIINNQERSKTSR